MHKFVLLFIQFLLVTDLTWASQYSDTQITLLQKAQKIAHEKEGLLSSENFKEDIPWETPWSPKIDDRNWSALNISTIDWENQTLELQLIDSDGNKAMVSLFLMEPLWQGLERDPSTFNIQGYSSITEMKPIAGFNLEVTESTEAVLFFQNNNLLEAQISFYRSHRNPCVKIMNGLKQWQKITRYYSFN